MDDKTNQLNKEIQSADFLTGEEKSLLADLLPYWPSDYFDALASALSGVKTSGVSIADLKRQVTGNSQSIRESLGMFEGGSVKLRHPDTPRPVFKVKAGKAGSRYAPGDVVPSMAGGDIQAVDWRRPPVSTKDIAGNLYSINSSEQFSKITLADLRQGDFYKNLNLILHKIPEISAKEKTLPYIIIQNLEKSPVNQLFIRTGLALMDDISPDRSTAFTRVSNLMRSKYRDSFSKSEFDAFTEFKEQLHHYM